MANERDEGAHNDELQALVARIKELEAAAKVYDQQNVVNVQRVRVELEQKLCSEQSENKDLNRKLEDYLREVAELRERNGDLEAEMAKVSRFGKRQEVDFAEEARTWAGIHLSEKLSRNGDFILAYRDPSGAVLEPRMLVDNKDKAAIGEPDIKKLIRDAKEHRTPVGVIVARDENQLRQVDRECRWAQGDGVWILRTTRSWLRRDLDVLRPLLERMRTEGADFLQNNAALAEEIRRTLVDLDEVEKELKKAAKAIEAAAGLTGNHRARLQALCDNTTAQKIPH